MNKNSIFARNHILFSHSDQNKLRQTQISIAGLGGIGGHTAEIFTRIGVCNLKISDPQCFKLSDLNRQFGSSHKTLHKNKSSVIKQLLKNINPEMNIKNFPKGIYTQRTADAFCKDSSIIINQVDITGSPIAKMLYSCAKQNNAFYFTSLSLGWGALVMNFSPKNTNCDLNQFIDSNLNINTFFSFLPDYAKRKLALAAKIYSKQMESPAICLGTKLGALILSNEVINLITKKNKPIIMPNALFIDLRDRTIKTINLSK